MRTRVEVGGPPSSTRSCPGVRSGGGGTIERVGDRDEVESGVAGAIRDVDVRSLTEFLAKTGSRRRAVAIVGPPGIGKSWLAEAVATSLARIGITPCVAEDIDEPFGREAIRTALAIEDRNVPLVLTARALPEDLAARLDRTFERRVVCLGPLVASSARQLLASAGFEPLTVSAGEVVRRAGGIPRRILDLALVGLRADWEADATVAGPAAWDGSLAAWWTALLECRAQERQAIVSDASASDDPRARLLLAEEWLWRGHRERARLELVALDAARLDDEPCALFELLQALAEDNDHRAGASCSLYVAAARFEQHGRVAEAARCWHAVGARTIGGGDPRVGVEALSRAVMLADEAKLLRLGLVIRLTLADALIRTRQSARAADLIEEVVQLARLENVPYVLCSAAPLARMLERDGVGPGAAVLRARLEEAAAVAASLGPASDELVRLRVHAAELRWQSGDRDGALRVLGEPEQLAAQAGVAPPLAPLLPLTAVRLLGRHESSPGDLAPWRVVLGAYDAAAHGDLLTTARLEVDAWSARRRGAGDSRAAFDSVAAAWRELGDGKAARELEEIARAEDARQRARGAAAGRFDALTRRERQIAELVAEGRTNPEIARQLFLSPRTVDHHVGSILRKLELSTRRALVRGSLGS